MPTEESLIRFKRVVAAALGELENRRQEVNDLNVFPVADGDTGDNMALTMRAVVEELSELDDSAIETVGRDEIVSAVARAALLGARGNSGVILSQVVRGAAEELASRPGELVDPVLVSAAFARAADAAYASVRDPAEGTMLTAVRAMASRVAHDLAHMDTQRLGPEATAEEQDELLAEVLERALEAGKEAVERGPDQLAVLRDAGVVDAGAYGLTVIIAGCLAALRGQAAPGARAPVRARRPAPPRARVVELPLLHELRGHRREPRRPPLHARAREAGRLRTGRGRRPHAARARAHRRPDAAVALFQPAGEVSRFDVADMHEQVADRSARLAGEATPADQSTCAVVAVASGEGVKRLFEELGVLVVDGGPTMNPSTYELLAGIHAAPGGEVLVLPNSPNVILASERACELSEKPAAVVPTTAPQEGLAALLAFDPDRGARSNASAVSTAAEALRIGGVAPAARDDAQGRFIAGDAVGYAGGELVAWGDPAATLAATLDQLVDGAELLTCIAGEAPPLDQDDVQARLPDGVELEYHEGGQPAWWWLLCAE